MIIKILSVSGKGEKYKNSKQIQNKIQNYDLGDKKY